MCGIFGYVFNNTGPSASPDAAVQRAVSTGDVLDTLLNGLQKLEYRGYDSAGGLCSWPRPPPASTDCT